ncbi:MAG: DNA internalization-related competence protein ComEC/Rec2 [Acidobacteria bacterium]|nr:DNA internalization-related competence protein ComEC/Rec2 [Acidobacteriota bacterium]
MASVGLLPGVVFLVGAVCGLHLPAVAALTWLCGAFVVSGWIAWWAEKDRIVTLAMAGGFFCAGICLAADARHQALHTPLRALLDREIGGFSIESLGPAARHEPMLVRARLIEDASLAGSLATLSAHVLAVQVRGTWLDTHDAVGLSIGGGHASDHLDEWLAGRIIEAPVTFRRPSRYLNDGVPDFERDLAMGGTTLFASAKSALLVRVVEQGSRLEEAAARVRQHVRRAVNRWVGRHENVAAAIVTAVLIGDRSGLPDDIRLRLQAAGTYHVIAISGGNIAILAALILGTLYVFGLSGRFAAFVTMALLVAYAEVVTSGPSVWRATLMAVAYLGARVMDHRSPPWHALAIASLLIVAISPLSVRDVGFVLTFGATAALLEGARRLGGWTIRHRGLGWLVASLAASVAAEVALFPVSAWMFSRVTSAGLVLNLVAVPLMGLVQVAGLVVVCLDSVDMVAAPAGWVAYSAAQGLIDTARLVELWPWLSARVPPPSLWLMAIYYAGASVALMTRGVTRGCGLLAVVVSVVAITAGRPVALSSEQGEASLLRLTAFDVGQGDATLLQFPDRSTMLVDTGGAPFGGGGFDIGSRVLSPALWDQGHRRLDRLVLTHGDPDHIGGARSVIEDFSPDVLWQGIPVAGHAPLESVLARARGLGVPVIQRWSGGQVRIGNAFVRVLHPPPPDWERRRVRNDDSLVLEVTLGDVAILLLGDVGAVVERSLVSQLTPARHRILKVGHHGSRTSTSRELLDGWRPDIALISCGRGNSFGHPAPEVLERLASIGATVYRTDLHGQISLETDGARVQVETYVGEGR